MNNKTRKILNIIVDILIILSFIWIMIALQNNLFHCDDGGWSKGWKSFKYFTNLGNLLLAFSSFVSLLLHLLKKEKNTSFCVLRLSATVATTITMLVTYITLSSSMGWYICFQPPAYLFEHTLLPLFAFLQLLLLDEKKQLHWYHSFYALILPSLYMLVWIIVLLSLDLPLEVETDLSVVPYFFLAIHNQPIYMTILYILIGLSASFFLGWLFQFLNNLILKKKNQHQKSSL